MIFLSGEIYQKLHGYEHENPVTIGLNAYIKPR